MYIRYPTGGGSGQGVATYATFASFPASATNGTLALALDTDKLYAFNTGSMTWVLIGAGDELVMGNLDAETANAQGATIDTAVLTMQSASATVPGLVNNTTQSFSGNKTFTGTVAASNLSGTNTGDVTLAAVGSSPNANAASLSGQALTLQPADATNPGVITTGTQTIAGAKTFSGTLNNSTLTASQAVVTDASKNLASLAYASANTALALVQRDGSGNFSAGTITADLNGNATSSTTTTTATNANNMATVAVSNSASYYPIFAASSSNSNQPFNLGTGLTFNPSTNVLTTTTFVGALTGTASGNTTITPNQYGVVLSGAANALQVLAPDASTTKVLKSGGASANPSWLAYDNANTVSTLVFRDSSGNFSAGTITAALTGTASGNTTYSANNHGVVLSSATNAMTVLAPNASTAFPLVSGGASADPSWALLTVAGGGTGLASGTSGGILGFTASGTLASSGALTANQVIIGGGAGATPSTLAAGTAGNILRMMGTTAVPAYIRDFPVGKVNYIDANPAAFTDTNGWATYADAAQNIPVNGTGGTATGLTFTRSTSSPIRNAAQFSLVQDAANRQGSGVSYDFTIDSADQAKPLSVAFDFNASSGFVTSNGTTAPLNDGTTSTNAGNSDLEVFLYDVTNSVLIPVSPQVITAKGTNNFTFKGIFQTASNSTSYRLIFHIATANTTGWTFLFTNVYVGPQILVQGSPITDWTSTTVTGAWVSNTTYTAQYCRVGDSYEFDIQVATSGAPTSANLTITLPSGIVIDTTKLTSTSTNQSIIPESAVLITDAGNQSYPGYVAYSSTTAVAIFAVGTASTYGTAATVTQAVPFTFGAGDFISIKFRIPVVGCSSTVQMSNDTDTRVVAFLGTGTPANVTSTNAIIFPTATLDTHGAYATATGLYTVPVSGNYEISCTEYSTPAGTTNVGLYVNGASTGFALFRVTGTSADTWGSGTLVYPCKAGDVLSVRPVTQNLSTFGSAGNISIRRLSGPATIAATDTVAALYTTASGTIDNTFNNITTYTTKVTDSHNAYSGGTYTVPVSGRYAISGGLSVTCTSPSNTLMSLAIYVNGTQKMTGTQNGATSQTSTYCNVAVNGYPLVAGDTVVMRGRSGATGPAVGAATAAEYFSIARIGN